MDFVNVCDLMVIEEDINNEEMVKLVDTPVQNQ